MKNVLEKILEEVEERIKKLKEVDNMCRVNAERNRNFESVKYFQSLMFATERAESIIGDIIRSHMDEAKDINVPSNGGWIPVEEQLPEDCEEIVLAQVSGKVTENIWFDNAFELATYVNWGGLDFRELSGMEKSEGNSMATTSRTIPTKGAEQWKMNK